MLLIHAHDQSVAFASIFQQFKVPCISLFVLQYWVCLSTITLAVRLVLNCVRASSFCLQNSGWPLLSSFGGTSDPLEINKVLNLSRLANATNN